MHRIAGAGGIMLKCFAVGEAPPPASAHDAVALFRDDDGRGAVYFGRVDQMMGDFIPQNAFRAWLIG